MGTALFIDDQPKCQGIQVTVPSCIVTNFNSSVEPSPFSNSNFIGDVFLTSCVCLLAFQIILNTWILTNAQADTTDVVPGGEIGGLLSQVMILKNGSSSNWLYPDVTSMGQLRQEPNILGFEN